ncbi:MAG: hypothetical protein M3394_01275 [Actinomycetota bacterium]|nr:hypothetical protein [Actinomycetota bacterium]
MTVAEQARHRLHAHLEEIMGEEHAAAVMEWLPDGPLASKADIDHVREVMDIRWEQTATKADLLATKAELLVGLADVRTEMHRGFTRQTWALVSAVSVINGLMLAALRLV